MKTAETTAIEADNYTGRKNKHIPTATNSCIRTPRHYTYTPLKISIHWSWIKINFTTLPTLEINSCDTTRATEPLSRLSGAAQRTTSTLLHAAADVSGTPPPPTLAGRREHRLLGRFYKRITNHVYARSVETYTTYLRRP